MYIRHIAVLGEVGLLQLFSLTSKRIRELITTPEKNRRQLFKSLVVEMNAHFIHFRRKQHPVYVNVLILRGHDGPSSGLKIIIGHPTGR